MIAGEVYQNQTDFVTTEYDIRVDKYGSFTVYLKPKEKEVDTHGLMPIVLCLFLIGERILQ